MKARLALVAGLAGLAALAAPSSAATAPQVTDQAGDANAANGQGFVVDGPADGSPGPGSQDAKDILSLTLVPTKKGGACTGFTATLEFTGTPNPENSMFRVESTSTANPTFLLLQFGSTSPGEAVRTSVRVAGGATGSKTFTTEKPAVVDGKKIVWTITLNDLKTIGESTKTSMDELGASAAASPGGTVYLPKFDIARSDKSVKVCG